MARRRSATAFFGTTSKILEKSNAARVDIYLTTVRKDLLVYVGFENYLCECPFDTVQMINK